MNVSQVGLLVAETVVMATLVLALFRARSVLGLSPLYIVMGGFQYLEATLSVQVEVWPDLIIYPGSSVMFTANLLAVLLVYIKEDALETRKMVYGLVLANFGLTLVSLLVSAHFILPGVRGAQAALGAAEFINNAQIAMVGATLLFVDVVGIILVYEYVSKILPSLFLRILTALLVVVAFDNIFFVGFLFYDSPNLGRAMYAGFVGKAAAAAFYALFLWGYLRFVEPHDIHATEGDVADVFQMLTYRQKYELARERMVHDALTGLYNRGYFDDVVPQVLARARRYEEPLSLIIVDVDHFKAINDRFSHLEGDRVMRLVGSTINDAVRSADIACRYGGDEFVIVLPRTDGDAARIFAERVQQRLADRVAAESPRPEWFPLTTTIGVATYPTDVGIRNVEDLLRIADRRLYEGKRLGRDRVIGAIPVLSN